MNRIVALLAQWSQYTFPSFHRAQASRQHCTDTQLFTFDTLSFLLSTLTLYSQFRFHIDIGWFRVDKLILVVLLTS